MVKEVRHNRSTEFGKIQLLVNLPHTLHFNNKFTESLFLGFLKEDLFYFTLNNFFRIFISDICNGKVGQLPLARLKIVVPV